MNFNEIRTKYIEARREQKQLIIKQILNPLGLTATMQGGAGKSNYTSNNTTAPFDLSYWLWVDGKINGKTAVTMAPFQIMCKVRKWHKIKMKCMAGKTYFGLPAIFAS